MWLLAKKHTGATRGHNHVKDVLSQLVRNTVFSVRVNDKLSTKAAASIKQGDIELVNVWLDGSNNLVIDISISCDHISNSAANNGHLNGKMQTNDYLQVRACVKIRKYSTEFAVVGTAFAPAIVSVAGQIHTEFHCLLWVLADKLWTDAQLLCAQSLARPPLICMHMHMDAYVCLWYSLTRGGVVAEIF